MIEPEHLRSGAMNDESIQEMDAWLSGGDGLYPGQAAKIAERILAGPETLEDTYVGDLARAMDGQVEVAPEGWYFERLKDGETRGQTTRGLRPGYADDRVV